MSPKHHSAASAAPVARPSAYHYGHHAGRSPRLAVTAGGIPAAAICDACAVTPVTTAAAAAADTSPAAETALAGPFGSPPFPQFEADKAAPGK